MIQNKSWHNPSWRNIFFNWTYSWYVNLIFKIPQKPLITIPDSKVHGANMVCPWVFPWKNTAKVICWHDAWYCSHHVSSYLYTLMSYCNNLNSFGAEISLIARFMGPTWGPSVSCWSQMGPMLAPWTFLSGILSYKESSEGELISHYSNMSTLLFILWNMIWSIINYNSDISLDRPL